MASERTVQFSSPTWLRNLGFSSWLLVGFVLVIVGLIWLLAETSTIVMPVILATALGAVAGPAVGWLERHRVPRIGGALLVLLGLVAIGMLIFCLVFSGKSAQSGDISAKTNQALDKIQGWLGDLGVDNAQSAKEAAPEIRTTLLSGVAAGIDGLKSLVFFVCVRGAQHAVRAQGRAGHAPLQPAPAREPIAAAMTIIGVRRVCAAVRGSARAACPTETVPRR